MYVCMYVCICMYVCMYVWSYLAPFLRYGDLLAENCVFSLPLCYLAPSLPMFPLEFWGEVNREETRVMGYLVVKVA